MSHKTLVTPGAAADPVEPKVSFLKRPIGKSAPKPASGRALELGASPRANLLPPEVLVDLKRKGAQRALWVGVAGVVVVVLVGTGAAVFTSITASMNLLAAQDESTVLAQEQATHSEIRDIKANVALSEAARQVGTSTEIDWKTYLLALQDTLPSGVAITSVSTDGATPITDYAQSDTPLEGARVGTLTFEAISPELPSIPVWLGGLATLDGFVDAVPNSVTLNEDGGYLVSMSMHINAEAYSQRFAAQGEDE